MEWNKFYKALILSHFYLAKNLYGSCLNMCMVKTNNLMVLFFFFEEIE